ncbi:endonuclease domain-containing protein [Streptosporangium sp. NPDC001681]|uniref:endonuclease domain-containing protein n=1 Tax=Streptosporangium sp. NPDC001681 TaxID=3154395 RepID=UPI0033186EBC
MTNWREVPVPDRAREKTERSLRGQPTTHRCGRPKKVTAEPCRALVPFYRPACLAHLTVEERAESARLDAVDAEQEAAMELWRDAREPACWGWPLRLGPLENDKPTTALTYWQDGRCGVCGGRDGEKVWDHDHATDLVRGLLCVSCNLQEPGGGGLFQRYRERPPTKILGLEIEHFGRPSLGAPRSELRLEDDPSQLIASATEPGGPVAAATHAWSHHCGAINLGSWKRDAVCSGCRFSVEGADDVQQFKLTRVW